MPHDVSDVPFDYVVVLLWFLVPPHWHRFASLRIHGPPNRTAFRWHLVYLLIEIYVGALGLAVAYLPLVDY